MRGVECGVKFEGCGVRGVGYAVKGDGSKRWTGVRVLGAVWGVIRFVGTTGGPMFQHMQCHLGFP